MALRGLKVVEMAGLAPVPFAGMILAGEEALQLQEPKGVGGVTKIHSPSLQTLVHQS